MMIINFKILTVLIIIIHVLNAHVNGHVNGREICTENVNNIKMDIHCPIEKPICCRYGSYTHCCATDYALELQWSIGGGFMMIMMMSFVIIGCGNCVKKYGKKWTNDTLRGEMMITPSGVSSSSSLSLSSSSSMDDEEMRHSIAIESIVIDDEISMPNFSDDTHLDINLRAKSADTSDVNDNKSDTSVSPVMSISKGISLFGDVSEEQSESRNELTPKTMDIMSMNDILSDNVSTSASSSPINCELKGKSENLKLKSNILKVSIQKEAQNRL
jgi:hypothetical protein